MAKSTTIGNWRDRLISRGHQFRTQTDSETIIHTFEEWGTDSWSMLSGMFAIGIWDGPRRRMVLARDPARKKAVVLLCQARQWLALWIDIAAVGRLAVTFPGVDNRSVYRYITHGFVPSPDSISRDTK